ncbi:hypothetical protein EIL87_14120 [Saccharopolyspora rhizosphaerae]|uniref:Outer membrane channel protein CpnT-like N-terminal domain-containing protein n=1 Tax=Saccharopolyspora rhizosphaerae TaxID=2492662 RepID=A0A3R8Q111_9PSEU|nr:hypothetical protein [Saccharopolyspora rhizosphaerae]RRO16184.1 hypothetical protein EIL87_14120 [Saccharopolyspora rhizosphaerae]
MTSKDEMVVTADESTKEAEKNNTANPLSGAGGAENFYGVCQAIDNNDWDSAGLNALGLGVDAVGLAADPLGTLLSWGFGWVIENVSFLREPFDALMGNPDAIGGMASTWENVGIELKAVGQEYGQSVNGTTGWEGQAGDAYRKLGSDVSQKVDQLAAASTSMKSAVNGAGAVVGAVRGIVRDIIAGAVGEIVSCLLKWGIAAACTAGIAAGGAIADAVRIAMKWAEKISEWMKKLGTVLHNLWSKLDELGSVAASLRKGVDGFFRNLGEAPGLNPNQKAITEQSVTEAARKIAPSTTTASSAKRGFLAGGADFKPAFRGDLADASYSPVTAGWDDYGASKFGYEVVKETAKLDDGSDEPENNRDGG